LRRGGHFIVDFGDFDSYLSFGGVRNLPGYAAFRLLPFPQRIGKSVCLRSKLLRGSMAATLSGFVFSTADRGRCGFVIFGDASDLQSFNDFRRSLDLFRPFALLKYRTIANPRHCMLKNKDTAIPRVRKKLITS
jgi:hypothetical protein